MKVDTALIEGFDGMSDSEKLNAILEHDFEAPKPDDSEEVRRLKSDLSKYASQIGQYKKDLAALRTDEQNKAAEREQAQKELQEKYNALLKDNSINAAARKYVELGMDADLAMETARAKVDGDDDKVFENLSKFKSGFEKSIRAEVTRSTPKPDNKGGSSGGNALTKADIMKIKDASERRKAIAEHPELFGI